MSLRETYDPTLICRALYTGVDLLGHVCERHPHDDDEPHHGPLLHVSGPDCEACGQAEAVEFDKHFGWVCLTCWEGLG